MGTDTNQLLKPPGSSTRIQGSTDGMPYSAPIDGTRSMAILGVFVFHIWPSAPRGGCGSQIESEAAFKSDRDYLVLGEDAVQLQHPAANRVLETGDDVAKTELYCFRRLQTSNISG